MNKYNFINIFVRKYSSNNKNSNIKLCKNCKYYIYIKPFDGEIYESLCSKFTTIIPSTKDMINLKTKYCRDNDDLCGKRGVYYDKSNKKC